MLRIARSFFSVLVLCLSVAAALALPSAATAQVTLTGTYVRYVSVGPNGVMIDDLLGQSMAYGETATGPVSCDLYYPGSPVEGFTVQATAGGTMQTLTNNGPFGGDLATTAGPTLAGRSITWSGAGTMGGVSVSVTE